MSENPYYKLDREQPVALALRLQLDRPALALLAPGQTVADYVLCLAQHGQFPAALTVLAHALPKREAVWWGCTAIRQADPPAPDSPAEAALAAAEAWVYHPDEQNRLPIADAAARAGLGSPAGWTALGAFWSEGSLAPPGSPVVAPKDDLTGKAVAGAMSLVAIDDDPQRAAGKSVAFIKMAFDIAHGGDGRHLPV